MKNMHEMTQRIMRKHINFISEEARENKQLLPTLKKVWRDKNVRTWISQHSIIKG